MSGTAGAGIGSDETGNGMEDLRVNTPEAAPSKESEGGLRQWLPPVVYPWFGQFAGRVEEFKRWAAPAGEAESEPELEAERLGERERRFVPVAVLLGLALLAQYVQFSMPVVSDFLQFHDIRARPAWMAFLIFKQWTLFVLILLALALKEERLESVGFPRLGQRRLAFAGVLMAVTLGAALLNLPRLTPLEAQINWLLPAFPVERVLSVLTALTAAVVEETFFRGFAIVWTYRWSGHLGVAVLFPALVFAAGHSYLSWANVPFALLAALVFSGLFLWKRDLYWPMVIHFAVNNLDLFS